MAGYREKNTFSKEDQKKYIMSPRICLQIPLKETFIIEMGTFRTYSNNKT
jgi:hypothetical protein